MAAYNETDYANGQTNAQKIAELSNNPNIKKIIDEVTANFKKRLPNGFIRVDIRYILGAHISVVAGMIGSSNDLTSQIRDNDPALTTFFIDFESDTKFETKLLRGGSISIKPEAGSHYAMERYKIPYRKVVGDASKVIKSLDGYFKKLGEGIAANADNIYGGEKLDKKYFKVV